MGLFDFLKDVGTDLFGGGNEAEALETLLKKDLGDGISQLTVTFEDGVATLKGHCDSLATKEKAILLAGNTKGVEKVNADEFAHPAPEESRTITTEPETEFYTIQKGDSLSKIAAQYYGDAMKYPLLFEANREVIKDPDLIYPGQTIRIPQLSD